MSEAPAWISEASLSHILKTWVPENYAQDFLSAGFYLKSIHFHWLIGLEPLGYKGKIMEPKKTSWHQGNISRMFQSWLVLIYKLFLTINIQV